MELYIKKDSLVLCEKEDRVVLYVKKDSVVLYVKKDSLLLYEKKDSVVLYVCSARPVLDLTIYQVKIQHNMKFFIYL